MSRQIVLAEPHGFCTGVRHALEVARKAVVASARPVYCLHELVHNRLVVESLAAAGMVFVQDLAEVPDGGTVLFSAHGVSPAVRRAAEARGLTVIDATCVFVKLVHEAVRRHAAEGCHVLLVGNRDHDEVVGVAGEAPDAVTVDEQETEDAIVYTLSVAPDDMGRVIGKHGKIAKAIRSIVKSASYKLSKKVVVEIKD